MQNLPTITKSTLDNELLNGAPPCEAHTLHQHGLGSTLGSCTSAKCMDNESHHIRKPRKRLTPKPRSEHNTKLGKNALPTLISPLTPSQCSLTLLNHQVILAILPKSSHQHQFKILHKKLTKVTTLNTQTLIVKSSLLFAALLQTSHLELRIKDYSQWFHQKLHLLLQEVALPAKNKPYVTKTTKSTLTPTLNPKTNPKARIKFTQLIP